MTEQRRSLLTKMAQAQNSGNHELLKKLQALYDREYRRTPFLRVEHDQGRLEARNGG